MLWVWEPINGQSIARNRPDDVSSAEQGSHCEERLRKPNKQMGSLENTFLQQNTWPYFIDPAYLHIYLVRVFPQALSLA